MADNDSTKPDTTTTPVESANDDEKHAEEAESTRDLSVLLDDGKNSRTLLCERCGSKMLLPGLAEFVTKDIFLPYMKIKSEQQKATDGEVLKDHWVVPDMFTFENIGFTNTVQGTTKYLICADCEVGPVGFHDLADRTKFFIALDRVKHEAT
ncbi:guanine nucleotide exchange factor MSS4-like [Diadema setosum]|uniref:guanine nucleotide exchange factor MSS4-like n=1 Tax=Diadema setosum TaxID=31175 RepID=UPI003B3BDEC0